MVWKLILLSVGCRFLICSASRIWSFCLLFWCSNIVVFSVRIFRSCVVGHECFFKCWAIELVSERCIVSLLDRVVEVKLTYIYTIIIRKYNIKSTREFIQVLHTIKPNNGILASLDVENLFTNVPVNETIDIIINNIYNNPSLPPLKINPYILRKLLLFD